MMKVSRSTNVAQCEHLAFLNVRVSGRVLGCGAGLLLSQKQKKKIRKPANQRGHKCRQVMLLAYKVLDWHISFVIWHSLACISKIQTPEPKPGPKKWTCKNVNKCSCNL